MTSTPPTASWGIANLIRVAVAWDQRNALPLWGTYIGPGSSFRGMDVNVSVIEETGGVPETVRLPEPVSDAGVGSASGKPPLPA